MSIFILLENNQGCTHLKPTHGYVHFDRTDYTQSLYSNWHHEADAKVHFIQKKAINISDYLCIY